jgi:hypothetical protein
MAQTKSAIRYSLRENGLRRDNGANFIARVHRYKTVGHDEFIDLMTERNTTVTRQDVLVVLDLMEETLKNLLRRGDCVSTRLFKARVSIRGGFTAADSDFDPSAHTVFVSMSAARPFKDAVVKETHTEKVDNPEFLPVIVSLSDFGSLTENSLVTPGNTAQLKGSHLDFGDADAEGLYFISEADRNRTVKADIVHYQAGKRIVFTVPALEPGGYQLVIRRASGHEIREGSLKAVVTVN